MEHEHDNHSKRATFYASPEKAPEADPGFFVNFGDLPDGPARAHEVRFPGGDSTSEVFQ